MELYFLLILLLWQCLVADSVNNNNNNNDDHHNSTRASIQAKQYRYRSRQFNNNRGRKLQLDFSKMTVDELVARAQGLNVDKMKRQAASAPDQPIAPATTVATAPPPPPAQPVAASPVPVAPAAPAAPAASASNVPSDTSEDGTFEVASRQPSPGIVEVACITNMKNPDKVAMSYRMLNESWAHWNNKVPIHLWDAVWTGACPTGSMASHQLDKDVHPPSKLIGISMAHQRIWQEYYRRHRHTGKRGYIVIMEDDAICEKTPWCSDQAQKHLQSSTADLVYLGWCVYKGKPKPPLCTHAYAVTPRGARTLFREIFPCDIPLDIGMSKFGETGAINWEVADLNGASQLVEMNTAGLWRQQGW